MTISHESILLASQSPRRRQLLEQIGVAHELLLPEAHEDAEALEAVLEGETPDAYVQRVTRAKLDAAVARRARLELPAVPVLVADTTVALGKRILGKPADEAEARTMLRALCGHTHRVLTAVAVACEGNRVLHALSVSRVRLEGMRETDIDAYIASGEPFGKAGAYGIQGRIAAFVAHVEGSYSGIMGLPLHETAMLLRQAHVRF
ncbi:Maf family protein [Azohydromonas lata]|uniref:dTTP/UTP pyrophosphatase n=1 Tax=Azohydromonas lata TaxID=45677 RepID=A0ABU5IFY7_9BURK|nr:Maf family protein [Azohydromonas lata]MDZ5457868.1 Maf family protein [Azohydromonas lata]